MTSYNPKTTDLAPIFRPASLFFDLSNRGCFDGWFEET